MTFYCSTGGLSVFRDKKNIAYPDVAEFVPIFCTSFANLGRLICKAFAFK